MFITWMDFLWQNLKNRQMELKEEKRKLKSNLNKKKKLVKASTQIRKEVLKKVKQALKAKI